MKNIPTEHLVSSYEFAIEAHREGPFAAFELCKGYELFQSSTVKKNEEHERQRQRFLRDRKEEDIPMPDEIKEMWREVLKKMEM